MKKSRNIAGRLSLGSFLETVSIVALAGGTIALAANLVAGAGFGASALNFLLGVVSLLVLGLVSFPVYCWAMKNGRLTPLTIVKEDRERQPEVGRVSPEAAPSAPPDEPSTRSLVEETMSRAKTIILLAIIVSLVTVVVFRETMHKAHMADFRSSVRSMSAAVLAKDSASGMPLQTHVLSRNSGEDLEQSSHAYSEYAHQVNWVTTKPKTIGVTSPGYSTQTFVVASSWTNITAHLVREP